MPRRVRIYLHMEDETPGYIADYFRRKQISYDIVCAYLGQPIAPLDESEADLILWMEP